MRHHDAACRRVAPGLTALAAGREPLRDGRFVLDHLDRCEACLDALQDLTLTVYALRRLGELPEATSIGPSAWPRVRERILRSRASAAALAWRWRTTLAGTAASALVVAALAAPLALHLPVGASGGEPVGYSAHELDLFNRRIEQNYISDARTGVLTTTSTVSVSPDWLPRRYPDGIAPEPKEVQSRTSGRPPTVD
jgi:hypothetical protein